MSFRLGEWGKQAAQRTGRRLEVFVVLYPHTNPALSLQDGEAPRGRLFPIDFFFGFERGKPMCHSPRKSIVSLGVLWISRKEVGEGFLFVRQAHVT